MSTVSSAALAELGNVTKQDEVAHMHARDVTMRATAAMPVWRRHANFAFAQVEFKADQNLSGMTTWGEECVTAKCPQHGSFLRGTYVYARLGALSIVDGTIARASGVGDAQLHTGDTELQLHWCEEVGHALIQEAEWAVDSLPLDRVTSESMHVYHELRSAEGKVLRDAIGRRRLNVNNSLASNVPELETFAAVPRDLYVPLPFAYADSEHSPLPIVAMPGSNIEFRLKLRARSNLIVALDTSQGADIDAAPGSEAIVLDPATQVSGGELLEFAFVNDVIFMPPSAEREIVCGAQSSDLHYFEYTQLMKSVTVAAQATAVTLSNLGFKNSVTTMYAFYRPDSATVPGRLEYFDFGVPLSTFQRPRRWSNAGAAISGITSSLNPIRTLSYEVNSMPRLNRHAVYLREIQARLHFNRIPSSYIMVYSHAAQPLRDAHHTTGSSSYSSLGCVPLSVTFNDVVQVTAESLGPYVAPLHTGVPAGKLYVFARAQGFYRVKGKKMHSTWMTA